MSHHVISVTSTLFFSLGRNGPSPFGSNLENESIELRQMHGSTYTNTQNIMNQPELDMFTVHAHNFGCLPLELVSLPFHTAQSA